MNRPLIYLAGPIAGLTYDQAIGRRRQAEIQLKNYGIDVLYPVINPLSPGQTYGSMGNDAGAILTTPKAIVTSNRRSVQTCDAILLNLLNATKVSIESCVELGWAYAYRKPVVTIMEEANFHRHAFVQEISCYIATNLVEGLDAIIGIVVTRQHCK